ncbi:MAG: penicillin acylase family protein [Sandaracinaceae bacterium]|nr:penicillin acylase family protein [Sandaracinaceae bacterium]
MARIAPSRLALLALLVVGCDESPPAVDAGPDVGVDAAVADAGPPPPMFDPPSHTLSADVEVVRDSLGMVHIYAQNDEDLFFASGYAQAADRLFSMDLARRQALGRRAEVLGSRYVDDDSLVRIVGVERYALLSAARMREERPEDFALANAWAAGINARIEEILRGDAPLPFGYGPGEADFMPEPWAVTDGFAVGRLLLFGNANQIEFDLLATILRDYVPDAFERVPLMRPLTDAFVLPADERPAGGSMTSWVPPARAELPQLPPDAARRLADGLFDIVPSPVAQFASNNWAVDGRHTASGRPLIAGDPHQGLSSPMLFFMQHLNSADAGGSFDVAGFSFVGSPAVQLGHNAHVAWTATTSYPDISDLWEVRADATSVVLGGETIPLARHEETILVRDGEPVTLMVEEVPGRGVLLPEGIAPVPVTRAGRRLLYDWVGFRPTAEAAGFIDIDRATDLDAFDAAVDEIELGCFNFVGATADGITYRSSMQVPDRGVGALTRAHWAMLDGDDADSLWTGALLPLSSLPHTRAADRGWIASANNDPFGFTADGTTSGDAFYFGVFFDPGTRATRIESELARLVERGALTPEDMMALQMDAHSVFADRLLPIVEDAWAHVPTDDALAEFRDRPELETLATMLQTWDGALVRESSTAVVFDAFMFFVTSGALEDDFGLAFEAILGENPSYMIKWAVLTLEGAYPRADELLQEGRDVLVLRALSATAGWLERRFGSVDPSGYTWGDHHGTHFGAEYAGGMDGGWYPTDGGVGTVNVSSASFLGSGGVPVDRLESGGGAVYRMVAEFAEDGVPSAQVTVSRGNSGDPESPFFDNATDDWINGRYVPLRFRRADVDADAVESSTLTP